MGSEAVLIETSSDRSSKQILIERTWYTGVIFVEQQYNVRIHYWSSIQYNKTDTRYLQITRYKQYATDIWN